MKVLVAAFLVALVAIERQGVVAGSTSSSTTSDWSSSEESSSPPVDPRKIPLEAGRCFLEFTSNPATTTGGGNSEEMMVASFKGFAQSGVQSVTAGGAVSSGTFYVSPCEARKMNCTGAEAAFITKIDADGKCQDDRIYRVLNSSIYDSVSGVFKLKYLATTNMRITAEIVEEDDSALLYVHLACDDPEKYGLVASGGDDEQATSTSGEGDHHGHYIRANTLIISSYQFCPQPKKNIETPVVLPSDSCDIDFESWDRHFTASLSEFAGKSATRSFSAPTSLTTIALASANVRENAGGLVQYFFSPCTPSTFPRVGDSNEQQVLENCPGGGTKGFLAFNSPQQNGNCVVLTKKNITFDILTSTFRLNFYGPVVANGVSSLVSDRGGDRDGGVNNEAIQEEGGLEQDGSLPEFSITKTVDVSCAASASSFDGSQDGGDSTYVYKSNSVCSVEYSPTKAPKGEEKLKPGEIAAAIVGGISILILVCMCLRWYRNRGPDDEGEYKRV